MGIATKMKLKLSKINKLLIIILLPLFLQIFASMRHANRSVKEVNVNHLSDEQFVTDESIRRILLKDPQALTPLQLVDLKDLEETLNNHQMIEKAEVFYTIDGVLEATVKQRQPIARIYENGAFSYMDSQGKLMPLSNIYSARVPLVYGNAQKFWETTYQLVQFIKKDDFLTKNITEIKVTNKGDYYFRLRIPNFVVIFGKYENIEQKKANLKAFYRQMEKDDRLNDYKIVNLKYANQVVCTK
ncbi:cell division protein FtsQ/DivIB [Capnocytophaga canis]|uniref:Cell division protein FtsQ/DivIB C-terminal domain-containing protein n=1 Tax=Capnocytophaga canis TaxID=1848903 RepID=A0A0B7IQL4_9FLAO|nr:cell division protein FtsQ/DivIB [Capnocytophaga canis]CEN52894.1 conserved exported hypothetical protein [Capnocytophaga canis]